MSKSNTLQYIIFRFPFHMNRKFMSLITHNFLNEFVHQNDFKIKISVKGTGKENDTSWQQNASFSLKNDIYIYHRCLFKKKDICKRMKNEGCQKVLNHCYLQCYKYPVTFLCTHSTNYFGFHIFEKMMIYHNIIIHCIIVVKITSVTILLIWKKYNSIKFFFLKMQQVVCLYMQQGKYCKWKKNTPHIFFVSCV